MYLYFGWACKGCSEDIPFKYLGKDKIRHGTEMTVPAVILVTCRKCGQTHDYSQEQPKTFRYPKLLPSRQMSN